MSKRQCERCGVSSETENLFMITMPPEITERTDYCHDCLLIVVDNSKKKNEVKSKENES